MELRILNLPADILRFIASNLPLEDIFKLSEINKKLKKIFDNLQFWENLFINKGGGKINIPENVDIKWFKNNLKQWMNIEKLMQLIKQGDVDIRFTKRFDLENIYVLLRQTWNNFEIAENVILLDCDKNKLTSLPSMLYLTELNCQDNQLTFLPSLPKLEILNCSNNQLTLLPFMPNLETLGCSNNKLISIPHYPNLKELYCDNNKLTALHKNHKLECLNCENNELTFLPCMINLSYLKCENNPLIDFTLYYWINFWVSEFSK